MNYNSKTEFRTDTCRGVIRSKPGQVPFWSLLVTWISVNWEKVNVATIIIFHDSKKLIAVWEITILDPRATEDPIKSPLFVCLFVFLSVCLSVCLSICLSVCQKWLISFFLIFFLMVNNWNIKNWQCVFSRKIYFWPIWGKRALNGPKIVFRNFLKNIFITFSWK